MLDWIDSYEARRWQSTTEGTVRYALLGLGWWTVDVALPAIGASELGEVTVLVSSSTEKAERIATENGVEQGISYEQFHDGVATDAYDAVYVGTPNAYHLEYVETAAEHGKDVLCEKPMESTADRAQQMVESCDAAGTELMIGYRMHTDPAVQRARELIDNGFLGDPVSIRGHNSQPLLDMIPDPDQWRLDPDRTGYGATVMDLGIYSINTTRFLLDRDPVAVQSRMTSTHPAFDGVPDERTASLLAFEDCEMVSTASQNAHEDTRLTITGTDGQIELSPAFHGKCGLHLSRNDLSINVTHETFDAERETTELFDYFSDRLLTDGDIYPDGHHGLVDMRIIKAIYEAADTEGVIEL